MHAHVQAVNALHTAQLRFQQRLFQNRKEFTLKLLSAIRERASAKHSDVYMYRIQSGVIESSGYAVDIPINSTHVDN